MIHRSILTTLRLCKGLWVRPNTSRYPWIMSLHQSVTSLQHKTTNVLCLECHLCASIGLGSRPPGYPRRVLRAPTAPSYYPSPPSFAATNAISRPPAISRPIPNYKSPRTWPSIATVAKYFHICPENLYLSCLRITYPSSRLYATLATPSQATLALNKFSHQPSGAGALADYLRRRQTRDLDQRHCYLWIAE